MYLKMSNRLTALNTLKPLLIGLELKFIFEACLKNRQRIKSEDGSLTQAKR